MIPLQTIIAMGFAVLVGAGLIIGSALYAKFKNHTKFTYFLVGMVPYCLSHLVGYLFGNNLLKVAAIQSFAENSPVVYNLMVVVLMAAVAVAGVWLVLRLYVGYELLDEPYAFSIGAGFASFQALLSTFALVMDHFSLAIEINYGSTDTSAYTQEALAERQQLIDTLTAANPMEYILVGIGAIAFFCISLATVYTVLMGMWTSKKSLVYAAFGGQVLFFFAYYLINSRFGFYTERIFVIVVGGAAAFLTWKLRNILERTPQVLPK